MRGSVPPSRTKRRDRARVLRGSCKVGIDGAVLFSSFRVAHSTDAPRCSSRYLSLGACASVRGENIPLERLPRLEEQRRARPRRERRRGNLTNDETLGYDENDFPAKAYTRAGQRKCEVQGQREREGRGSGKGIGRGKAQNAGRTHGSGACAGSCEDLAVLEEQITIVERDRAPRESLGEPERQLSFRLRRSRELAGVVAREKLKRRSSRKRTKRRQPLE